MSGNRNSRCNAAEQKLPLLGSIDLRMISARDSARLFVFADDGNFAAVIQLNFVCCTIFATGVFLMAPMMLVLRLMSARQSLNSNPEVRSALLLFNFVGHSVKLVDIGIARAKPVIVMTRFGRCFRFLVAGHFCQVAFRIRRRRGIVVLIGPRERMNQHVGKLRTNECQVVRRLMKHEKHHMVSIALRTTINKTPAKKQMVV